MKGPLKVRGTIRVPGDKSISHRALIVSALAVGTSRIEGLLESADIRSTKDALARLGVAHSEKENTVEVIGVGGKFAQSGTTLDCGNSGTTARLLAGAVAGSGIDATFEGDESLSRRPMVRLAEPLEAMGARVELPPHGGLPMRVSGGELKDIEWRTQIASGQVKSAVLLAGLAAGVRVSYEEPVLSRDHTERMLQARGARILCVGTSVVLQKSEPLVALDVRIPGDTSSAAYLMALAALATEAELTLEDVCLNATRTGVIEVFRRMGAKIEVSHLKDIEHESVGCIETTTGTLRGTTIAASEIPSLIDELPLIACLASRAEGETVISGAGELRVKESDRIAAVVAGLQAIGVDAEESEDGMRIAGSDRPLRGRVETRRDHRIAMAFGVLSALPSSAIVIDDPACVNVSYPDFWRDIAAIRH